LVKHRCAVCWENLQDHDDWYAHAVTEHGAVLAEFGFERCQNRTCPGVEHANKRVGYGTPPVRRRPDPQPFTARDGTTYTPIKLPLDAA
jgi:hypothetical protein